MVGCPNQALIRITPTSLSFVLSESSAHTDNAHNFAVRVVRIKLSFRQRPRVYRSGCPNRALIRTSPTTLLLELSESSGHSDIAHDFAVRVVRIKRSFRHRPLIPDPVVGIMFIYVSLLL